MRWPQIVMIVLFVIGLLVSAENHGKPRKPESFPAALIGICLEIWLLYCGGFWDASV